MFFFDDTATTEIYTLSLHDALPIFRRAKLSLGGRTSKSMEMASALAPKLSSARAFSEYRPGGRSGQVVWKGDRKSTRLNSSHSQISYAVFCLKKKKQSKVLH